MPVALPLPLLRYAIGYIRLDLRTVFLLAAVCRAWRGGVWRGTLLRDLEISDVDVWLSKKQHSSPRLPPGLRTATLSPWSPHSEDELQPLHSVHTLQLSHFGKALSGLHHLTSLRSLTLGTALDAGAAAMAHLSCLTQLSTTGSGLNVSNMLRHLPHLRSVAIVCEDYDVDDLFSCLPALPELTCLDLRGLMIYLDVEEEVYASMTGLTSLRLEFMGSLTDSAVQYFTQLRELDCRYMQLGVTEAGYRHLRRLTSLACRDLGSGVQGLAASLRRLHVYLSEVEDDCLRHMTNLTELRCTGCLNLTQAVLPHLVKLKELHIDGGSMMVDAPTDSTLSHLTGLRVLRLTSCQRITAAAFSHLPSLRELDISSTPLMCHAVLAQLTQVTSLSLRSYDRTKATDICDASFTHLGRLRRLDMSTDSWGPDLDITAATFSHLSSLVELNIRGNKIPEEACQYLTGLTKLDSLACGWSRESFMSLKELRELEGVADDNSRELVLALPHLQAILHQGWVPSGPITLQ